MAVNLYPRKKNIKYARAVLAVHELLGKLT